MALLIDDVVKRLTDANVGTFGTNIFASAGAAIPAGAGPYLTIVETGGVAPMRRHDDGNNPAYRRPSVQLMVRAQTYTAARTMLVSAFNALLAMQGMTVNGTFYVLVTPKQDITDLGLEPGTNRPRLVVNFDIMRAH
jgi:hypothetical protein